MPSGSEGTSPLQRPRRLSHRRAEETRGYAKAQQDRERGQSALQRQSSGRSTTSALLSSEDNLHAKRGESSSNRANLQREEGTRGRVRNASLPSGVEVPGGTRFAASLAPTDRGRKSEPGTDEEEVESHLPRNTSPSSSSDALLQEREALRTASASASARHHSSAGTLLDPGIASSRRSASGPKPIERATTTREKPSFASSSTTAVFDSRKGSSSVRGRPPRSGNRRQRLGGRKELSTEKEDYTAQEQDLSSQGQRGRRGGSEKQKHDSALTSSALGKRRKSDSEEDSFPLDTLQTSATAGVSATTKESKTTSSSTDSSPDLEAKVAEAQEEEMPMLNDRRYQLRIVQQPTLGCAFGTNILSRLAIAPPLIVRLHVVDRQGQDVIASTNLPPLICHASLTTESGRPADMLSPVSSLQARPRRQSASNAAPPTSPGSRRMLYGTLVASPLTLSAPEPYGNNGVFFFFPEISVRATGRFCLRITLMALPSGSSSTSHSQPLASISTAPFDIVTTANYVAPPITDITRHFAAHGVGLLLPPGHSTD